MRGISMGTSKDSFTGPARDVSPSVMRHVRDHRPLVSTLLICAALAFGGCGFFRRSPTEAPRLEEICIELKAPERLNWFRGQGHAVFARVYPLSAPDAFQATGAKVLLQDPAPFLPGVEGMSESRHIHPGTGTTFRFRLQSRPITHLGVVAGYYKPLDPDKILVPAPADANCAVVPMGESGFPAADLP